MYRFGITFFIVTCYQGSLSVCPHGWSHYAKENVCIRGMTLIRTWQRARVVCKTQNADLVQIWDAHKATFTKGIRPTNDYRYWIGASDVDGDGYFEHLNGTKVHCSHGDVRALDTGTQYCCAMEIFEKGHIFESCGNIRRFICESKVIPETSTTNAPITCNRDSWQPVHGGKKFLLTNRVSLNFSSSSKHCRQLGGQLLKITHKKRGRLIQDLNSLWKPGAMLFWIGLSQLEGEGWKWDDGTTLESTNYSHWDLSPSKGTSCVAVIWASDSKWREIRCASLNYHICQATAPCGQHIFMTVNDEHYLENNTVVVFGYKQNIKMHCVLQGTTYKNRPVYLTCNFDSEHAEERNRRGRRFLRAYIKLSGHWCGCRLDLKNGSLEIFNVQFEVVSNPWPLLRNITRNGQEIDPHEFPMVIKEFGHEFRYALVVVLPGTSQLGHYHIQIGNGVGEDLNLSFALNEPAIKKPSKSAILSWSTLTLLASMAVIIMVFVWIGYQTPRTDQQHAIMVESDSSSSYSYRTSTGVESHYADEQSVSSSL